MNERIQRLRNRILQGKPVICVERARIVTEAYKEYEALPIALLRAKTLQKLLGEMTIRIGDDELIVGNQGTSVRCAPVFPEFSVDWILKEMDSFDKRPAGKYFISEQDKTVLRDILPWWTNKTTKDKALAMIPEECKQAISSYAFILTAMSSGLGHISINYKKALTMGLEGVIAEAKQKLDALDMRNGMQLEKSYFYRSCIMVCEAVIAFAERFAALALEQAKTATPERAAELREIARVCATVPRKPATSFHEALQSFWFIHLTMQIDSNGHSMSPGRFDRYMGGYYANDISTGALQPDQAEELLACLWVKFNEVNKIRDEGGSIAFGGYPMFQNLIVGGVDEEGKDITNELSLLCCKVTAEIKLPQPSLSIRWHKQSPDNLMRAAAKVAAAGTGMPAYFNDEIIIPVLLNVGCTLEDARDYAEVGCVEPQPQGRCEGLYSGGYDNLCRLFELAVNDGRDLATGEQIGPHTGLEFASFDAFYQAFRRQLDHFIYLHGTGQNVIDLVHKTYCPTPLVSCFVDDCLERGVDIRSGGARYNFTSPNAVGLANVADSLETIRKKVFEEKKYSLGKIRQLLMDNYQGNEAVRQEFINDVPKYGNDVDSVDQLARRVGEDYCLEFKKYGNVRNGGFQPGLQSISAHALFVGTSSATPDGRRREDLVSDGGVSPAQGRDTHGPTAICRSVAKLNHLESTNGALLNIKFHPSAVEGDRGLQNVMDMVDGFFSLGGQHTQFNVVSTEMLRKAQANPEKYADLVVRVAGFSVLFTSLDRVLQNDIIERTEHAS